MKFKRKNVLRTGLLKKPASCECITLSFLYEHDELLHALVSACSQMKEYWLVVLMNQNWNQDCMYIKLFHAPFDSFTEKLHLIYKLILNKLAYISCIL